MSKSSLPENLRMISDSVLYLKKAGLEVHYDAEHFYDGFKENAAYALKTIQAAVNAGADFVVLCDTNGGCMYHEIDEITRAVIQHFPEVKFGIHAHNDGGLAVANTIAAVRAGAAIVQGTINGYGERCGNADLITIIGDLTLKMGYDCGFNNADLSALSLAVSEITNRSPFEARPYAGRSAFAHKGGAHVNLVKKDPRTYEHIEPTLVGNRRRILISEVAGKSNLMLKMSELGLDLSGEQISALLATIKEKEKQGIDLETADASLFLLAQRLIYGEKFTSPFDLESFTVVINKEKDRPCSSKALVSISSNGKNGSKGAEGKGPVDALKKALLPAIGKMKKFDHVHLIDFKVRVVNGHIGTDAQVKVSMTFGDSKNTWQTIGVSHDIIEACWQAMFDAMQYRLLKH